MYFLSRGGSSLKQNILVIEDERKLTEVLKEALEELEYSVEMAFDGESGLDLLLKREFDLAIIDVMIPLVDGFEVLRRARAEGLEIPLLLLTAKTGTSDRVAGLDLGADDYIAKPFRLPELLARIRAHLRREKRSAKAIVVGDLRIETSLRKVTIEDRPVFLSPTEFAVLYCLASRAGEPVPKSTILKEVWTQESWEDPHIVEVYINYLRTKLDNSSSGKLIHTIRNQGYMLRAGHAG